MLGVWDMVLPSVWHKRPAGGEKRGQAGKIATQLNFVNNCFKAACEIHRLQAEWYRAIGVSVASGGFCRFKSGKDEADERIKEA